MLPTKQPLLHFLRSCCTQKLFMSGGSAGAGPVSDLNDLVITGTAISGLGSSHG